MMVRVMKIGNVDVMSMRATMIMIIMMNSTSSASRRNVQWPRNWCQMVGIYYVNITWNNVTESRDQFDFRWFLSFKCLCTSTSSVREVRRTRRTCPANFQNVRRRATVKFNQMSGEKLEMSGEAKKDFAYTATSKIQYLILNVLSDF